MIVSRAEIVPRETRRLQHPNIPLLTNILSNSLCHFQIFAKMWVPLLLSSALMVLMFSTVASTQEEEIKLAGATRKFGAALKEGIATHLNNLIASSQYMVLKPEYFFKREDIREKDSSLSAWYVGEAVSTDCDKDKPLPSCKPLSSDDPKYLDVKFIAKFARVTHGPSKDTPDFFIVDDKDKTKFKTIDHVDSGVKIQAPRVNSSSTIL